MAQGVLAGGTLFLILTLFCSVISVFTPFSAWLTTRTEIYNDICWFGEGMWKTRFWWGNSVPGVPAFSDSCSSPRNFLPDRETVYSISPYNLSSSDATSIYCDGEYRDSVTCKHIKLARLSHVCSIAFILVALVCGALCHRNVVGVSEMWPALGAAVASLFAACASSATFTLMFSSPLFKREHFDYLSHAFNMIAPVEGLGCKYQSPFQAPHFVLSIITDSPLECVLPGPAFAFSLGVLVFSFFSLCCFTYLFFDYHRISKLQCAANDTQSQPLLSFLRGANSVDLDERTGMRSQIMQPRRYSLYGASLRHIESYSWLGKRVIATMMPICLIAVTVMFAVWMIMGLRFAVTVDIDIYDLFADLNSNLTLNEKIGIMARELDRTLSLHGIPLGQEERIHAKDSLANLVGQALASGKTAENNPLHIMTLVQSVFDFQPYTTTIDFLEGGAYFQTALMLVCCYFFPYFRTFVWLYVWYLPVEEVTRGRLLSWMDSLGKIAIANIFCLCLFTTAFLFDTMIDIPLLVAKLGVRVKVDLIPGFGSWGFISACIIANVLGEILIYFHGQATRWEELRRSGLTQKTSRTKGIRRRVISRRSATSMEWETLDTPFMDGQAGMIPTVFDLSAENGSVGGTPRSVSSNVEDHETHAFSDSAGVENGTRHVLRPRKYSSVWGHVNTLDDEMMPRISNYPVSLCNTTHTPVKGKVHTFSLLGKSFVTISLIAVLVCTIVGQYYSSFSFERQGLISIIIGADSKYETYSLGTIVDQVAKCGGPHGRRANSLALTIILFALIMPIVHLVCLVLLWSLPLRLNSLTRLFRLAEIAAAWNALDIFLVAIIACYTDLPVVSRNIIPLVVPALNDIAKNYAHEDLFLVTPSILNGFWWLCIGVVAEKLMTMFLVPLAATKIAEQKLLLLQKKSAEERGVITEEERDDTPPRNRRIVRFDNSNILSGNLDTDEDYARLLEIMTPTSRYVGVSGMPEVVYAGFPRWVWKISTEIGLLRDVTR